VHVVRYFAGLCGFADAAQLEDKHTSKTARQLLEAGGHDADLELLALLPREKPARPWGLFCLCTDRGVVSHTENIDREEADHKSDRKEDSLDEVTASVTASVLLGRAHPAAPRKCQEGQISNHICKSCTLEPVYGPHGWSGH